MLQVRAFWASVLASKFTVTKVLPEGPEAGLRLKALLSQVADHETFPDTVKVVEVAVASTVMEEGSTLRVELLPST